MAPEYSYVYRILTLRDLYNQKKDQIIKYGFEPKIRVKVRFFQSQLSQGVYTENGKQQRVEEERTSFDCYKQAMQTFGNQWNEKDPRPFLESTQQERKDAFLKRFEGLTDSEWQIHEFGQVKPSKVPLKEKTSVSDPKPVEAAPDEELKDQAAKPEAVGQSSS